MNREIHVRFREGVGVRFLRATRLVIHCRSLAEVEKLKGEIEERLAECKLVVSQEKTRIVYCKDTNRRGRYENTEYDFLGYTFRPRLVRNKNGKLFVSFTPAISRKAEKAIRDEMRSWRVHQRTEKDLNYLSRVFNPKLRGWIQYYGMFRVSALKGICRMFQKILVKWAKNKFKGLRRRWGMAWSFIWKIAHLRPALFVYWELGWCI
jgi:RNA-directed DNA polymerase